MLARGALPSLRDLASACKSSLLLSAGMVAVLQCSSQDSGQMQTPPAAQVPGSLPGTADAPLAPAAASAACRHQQSSIEAMLLPWMHLTV